MVARVLAVFGWTLALNGQFTCNLSTAIPDINWLKVGIC